MNNRERGHPDLLTISETAELTGLSLSTLRRWDERNKLKSFRYSPIGNRYYHRSDVENYLSCQQDLSAQAKEWAQGKTAPKLPEALYCQTRDIFSARLEHLQTELAKIPALNDLSSVVVAIVGEIGNNSFDHNLGGWPDIPGIFFGHNSKTKQIVLADRGQGILITLRQIRPQLKNDADALKTAFTEIISGRSPEARGNGLKFVREIITHNPLKLWFQTGSAELYLKQSDKKLYIRKVPVSLQGCLAIIKY